MCDDRERLIGYVYDECDANERRAIEAHLATCDDCRREIRGLRSVRQDLLAWSVPEHESIWRPLAATVVQPFWRVMPGWAMAAAAGIILLAGAAGGATAYAFLPRGAAAPTVSALAVPAAAPAPAPAAADWAAVEASVLAKMQREMDRRLREATTRAAATDARPTRVAATGGTNEPDDLVREVTALRDEQTRLYDTVFRVYNEQNLLRNRQNQNYSMLVSLVQNQSAPIGGR